MYQFCYLKIQKLLRKSLKVKEMKMVGETKIIEKCISHTAWFNNKNIKSHNIRVQYLKIQERSNYTIF